MKQTRKTKQKQNVDVLFLLMHIVFAPEFLPAFDFSRSLASQYSTSNSIEQLGYYYPPGSTFSPQPDESNIDRASDRVRQKMGNSAAFSREIMRQERSIMRFF